MNYEAVQTRCKLLSDRGTLSASTNLIDVRDEPQEMSTEPRYAGHDSLEAGRMVYANITVLLP